MRYVEEKYKIFLNQIEEKSIEFFEIFKFIDVTLNEEEYMNYGMELVIRLMDIINWIPESYHQLIFDLLEKSGYFPYMSPDKDTSLKTLLHYEFYRSENIPNIVLHRKQASVYEKLEDGKSVILSAPTSFGKSLLIEEIIASKKYNNIVVIFPTIALIDENREKLNKYREEYKIIFTTKQKSESKNIFLLTPERLIEFLELPEIDFFIIDEFYKLGEGKEDKNSNRSNVLNHAFYLLLKHTRHFYLLGPNINSIPEGFTEEIPCEFISTDYFTVANNYVRIDAKKNRKIDVLNQNLVTMDGPTLIYCKSPNAVEKNAEMFKSFLENNTDECGLHDDAIEWIRKNVHPGWSLISCLKYQIAFHHGSMPRHLSKYVINEFNAGNIKYLFCTTTLIEGVNTATKNVVVFDSTKGQRDTLSYFDFKNIKGRAGRMNQHFVGNVYTFFDPPKETKIEVDIPWFTQNKANDEILIQLDNQDLKESSKERIAPYLNQEILNVSTIRKNSNMNVQGQISLAQEIENNITSYHKLLCWSGIPKYEQLRFCCELLWKHNLINSESFVSSANQLAFYANSYKNVGSSLSGFINKIIESKRQRQNKNINPNIAVREASKIVKYWFEFKLPKALLTLDNIQKEILRKNSLKTGDYIFFSSSIESAFSNPVLAVLQEFGVPLTVIKKIEEKLEIKSEDVTIEEIVNIIKEYNLFELKLDKFEITILNDFLKSF